MIPFTRRDLLGATAATTAALALPRVLFSEDPQDAIGAEILKRHAEEIERLQ
ncbi:MAG: twin-arginine translocation signal domain-containing protein [Acidobacteriota bacterium]